jgi:2'-5' RNA ligase
MRIFVGVRLNEPMISAATAAVRQLHLHGVRVRWVTSENMHVTVRFIGNVDDDRVPGVLTALRPPLPLAAFDVALGKCGVFPPSGLPRIIWIGLASGLPSLRTMHEEFNRRLAPLGFEPEHRAFSAHLTLARISDAPRGSAKAIRQAVEAVRPEPVRCFVTSARVFQSRLSAKGASYHALLDVPCTG